MSDALKGATIAFANAILAGLPEFGIGISTGQQAALLAILNTAATLVMLILHTKGSEVARGDTGS